MSAVYHSLAGGNFSQDWSNAGLISSDDNWDGVPSIIGYRGDGLTGGTAVDPQTVTGSSTVVDVNANRSDPSVFNTGGIAEFDGIADRVVAFQGSGTARAPHLVIHLDATDREDVVFSARLRDIDTGTTSAQPVAVQYRIGDTGAWINLPAGFVANANNGGDTNISVALPEAVNGEAQVQVRIITTDAVGSDAFIGIDDILVTSEAAGGGAPGIFSINDAIVDEGNSGTTAISFEVVRQGGSAGAVSVDYTVTLPGGINGADAADFQGAPVGAVTVNFADGETSKFVTLQVVGDTDFEPDENFTVALSNATGGATIADDVATGTIANDDAPPPPVAGAVFINELHYDNAGTDTGEAVELAGVAGTDLSGWTLQFYNGSNTPNAAVLYRTTNLSGIIPDQDDGYGTVFFTFPVDGIQNGASDGIALVNAEGEVVQFLSYEGQITAGSGQGAAAGLTSTDIGVSQQPAPAVGLSLQLVGVGATYEDFTWELMPVDDSFGSVNTNQDFIGPDATGLVSIRDASVIEGDSGVSELVFVVRRAGGSDGEATVDYFLNLTGSADAADLAPGTPLSGTISFAAGEVQKTIVIGVVGDTLGEGNETLNVTLANPTGPIDIIDGVATGTILNDDPVALAIGTIQGAGHTSAYAGQIVQTTGIVTALASNGFYLQSAVGDGDAATSDAIFVFTGGAPTVAKADALTVTGLIGEFLPGGVSTNLTVTQISNATIVVDSSGNALPAATLIGTGGLLPPTENIDDDGRTTFDPVNDGIDFYEALEGMLVTVDAPLVVGTTNEFGETWLVASGGADATGLTSRDGIVLRDGDFNPERIQIDDGLLAGYTPDHTQGDLLSDVTGVFSYNFGNYELLVTEAFTVVEDVTLERETTELVGDADHLSIATFNVENLDGLDPQAKFDLLAGNIVYNLQAPDIIGVQEIQDADGAGNGSDLSGYVTAQRLIDTIAGLGGPNYVYIEVTPSAPGTTGGEPGGNIRNGFFYNADRVDYVDGSAELITSSAYNGSRNPLAASFTFNGETVTAISVHSTSRGGSDPLFGPTQPPVNGGEGARLAQSQGIVDYVNGLLAEDPELNIAVLGDFNAFYFEQSLTMLETGAGLTNLHRLLPEEERYSYFFEGNLQTLDHILVSGSLFGTAEFDAVHINAEQAESAGRGTDHDPLVATFMISGNEAPVAGDDSLSTVRNTPVTVAAATLLANDSDEDLDPLTIESVGNATNGTVTINEDGSITFTADHGFAGEAGFDYTVSDGNGGTDVAHVTVAVAPGGGSYVGNGNANTFTATDNGNWFIDGQGGADTLSGAGGDDTIIGGAGADVMSGGEGADIFRLLTLNDARLSLALAPKFAVALNQADTILDFEQGVDLIDLSALDANRAQAGDQAFTFIGAAAFSGTAGELRYEAIEGGVRILGDYNGDAVADIGIVLQGITVPVSTDFVL